MYPAKFSIEEIEIGDAIMFDDKQHDNFGSYWTVLSKSQNQITIELTRGLVNETYTVYITEVTHLKKERSITNNTSD